MVKHKKSEWFSNVLRNRYLILDSAVHLVAIAVLTIKTPCPTTLIRNGVLVPPPLANAVQEPDEGASGSPVRDEGIGGAGRRATLITYVRARSTNLSAISESSSC
jgi:hypothetical protein